jgi:hypothetical protein
MWEINTYRKLYFIEYIFRLYINYKNVHSMNNIKFVLIDEVYRFGMCVGFSYLIKRCY